MSRMSREFSRKRRPRHFCLGLSQKFFNSLQVGYVSPAGPLPLSAASLRVEPLYAVHLPQQRPVDRRRNPTPKFPVPSWCINTY
jgi:hypothetical protein